MSGDSALILLGLLLVACVTLYWVWLTEHPSDYDTIEHRKEGMEALRKMHEARRTGGHDDGDGGGG